MGGFSTPELAAAGSTTALVLDPSAAEGRLGVAIARGGGHFGPAQQAAQPRNRSFGIWPIASSVAVDRAGDVLLAYRLGNSGYAVHATERRAGRARFTSPARALDARARRFRDGRAADRPQPARRLGRR